MTYNNKYSNVLDAYTTIDEALKDAWNAALLIGNPTVLADIGDLNSLLIDAHSNIPEEGQEEDF